jgi:hypothetical protein
MSVSPSPPLQGSPISDHDLERCYLGMIVDERDLVVLEEHLIMCAECVERAQASDAYVDQIRATICSSAV